MDFLAWDESRDTSKAQTLWITIDIHGSTLDVHDPVFANQRLRVEFQLGSVIFAEAGVGDLDEEEDILGCGMDLGIILSGKPEEIRLGTLSRSEMLTAPWTRIRTSSLGATSKLHSVT